MDAEILQEVKLLRQALVQIVGTSNKPADEQFSIAALEKATQEFQKLRIERGEWVEENELSKIFKDTYWRTGQFIIEHFNFTRYFKKGRSFYFNKAELQNLAKELKARDVNLARYIDYKRDSEKFKKSIAEANENTWKKKLPYSIPIDAKNIQTTPPKIPDRKLIRDDIKNLKREFRLKGFSEYVDIYHDRYAMMKHAYYFEKYFEPGIKNECRRWIQNFNYANEALTQLKSLTKKNPKQNSQQDQ